MKTVVEQTVSRHIKSIEKVKNHNKWVPRKLNENEKKFLKLKSASSTLCVCNTDDSFIDQIFTCDEKWILYDNRKRSGQLLDRDEPPKLP